MRVTLAISVSIALGAAWASAPAAALEDPGFDALQAAFTTGQTLPGWRVLTAQGRRGLVETVPHAFDPTNIDSGRPGNVFVFESLSTAFGDNKLEQCVAFDASQPLAFTLRLRTPAEALTNDFGVRLNPNFYGSLEDCESDLADTAASPDNSANSRRLSGPNANNDYDVRFASAGITPNRWFELSSATHGTAGPIVIDAFPEGANVVRVSLRARAPNPTDRIEFGPLRVTNGGHELTLANAGFARVRRTAGQTLGGQAATWSVPNRDQQRPLEVVNVSDALSRPNVLRFDDLTTSFGDNRLDQCVPVLPGQDARLAVFARSTDPHPDLAVRLNLSFFTSNDCTGATVSALTRENDFSLGASAPNVWTLFEGDTVASTDLSAAGVQSANLSLRARNRSGSPRVIELDDVQFQSGVSFSVPGGVFDAPQTVRVENIPDGLIARFTLDGSTPQANSPTVPAEGVRIDTSSILSVRLFDADGNVRSATFSASYAIELTGAPAFLDLEDGFAFSGVVGDATDVWATDGLVFRVIDTDDEPANRTAPADLALTVSSSDTTVVDPARDVEVSRDGDRVRLRVAPAGVGFANLTLRLVDADDKPTTLTLRYAASASIGADEHTRWYSGRADASAAIRLDEHRFLVFDDEGDFRVTPRLANQIQLHDRRFSGPALARLDVDDALDLFNPTHCSDSRITGAAGCNVDGEVDFEAATRLGGRIYVSGSHSNNSNGRTRPDRWRFIGLDLSGTPEAPELGVAGFYRWLREDLRAWDTGNGHGLGTDHLGLVASSNGGDPDPAQAPESPNLNGFSIEGLVPAPADEALWFGFRAPLVSAPGQPAVQPNDPSGRTHALIVPVINYETLATAVNGGEPGTAVFGDPIRLDLGGRGIRSLARDEHGQYLILAGPSSSATGTPPRDFRIFTWSGRVDDAGEAIELFERDVALARFTAPNFPGSPEAFLDWPADILAGGPVHLVSDTGDVDFYGDGVAAKALPDDFHKKFRLDRVVLPAAVVGVCGPAEGVETVEFPSAATACVSGVFSAPETTADAYRWICQGTDAPSASCSAPRTQPQEPGLEPNPDPNPQPEPDPGVLPGAPTAPTDCASSLCSENDGQTTGRVDRDSGAIAWTLPTAPSLDGRRVTITAGDLNAPDAALSIELASHINVAVREFNDDVSFTFGPLTASGDGPILALTFSDNIQMSWGEPGATPRGTFVIPIPAPYGTDVTIAVDTDGVTTIRFAHPDPGRATIVRIAADGFVDLFERNDQGDRIDLIDPTTPLAPVTVLRWSDDPQPRLIVSAPVGQGVTF